MGKYVRRSENMGWRSMTEADALDDIDARLTALEGRGGASVSRRGGYKNLTVRQLMFSIVDAERLSDYEMFDALEAELQNRVEASAPTKLDRPPRMEVWYTTAGPHGNVKVYRYATQDEINAAAKPSSRAVVAEADINKLSKAMKALTDEIYEGLRTGEIHMDAAWLNIALDVVDILEAAVLEAAQEEEGK